MLELPIGAAAAGPSFNTLPLNLSTQPALPDTLTPRAQSGSTPPHFDFASLCFEMGEGHRETRPL